MEPKISPTEATQALEAAEEATKQMRRAIGVGSSWIFLVIWGVIWTLGFLGNQFLPQSTASRTWTVLDVLGVLLSFGIGAYYGRYRIHKQRRHSNGALLVRLDSLRLANSVGGQAKFPRKAGFAHIVVRDVCLRRARNLAKKRLFGMAWGRRHHLRSHWLPLLPALFQPRNGAGRVGAGGKRGLRPPEVEVSDGRVQ